MTGRKGGVTPTFDTYPDRGCSLAPSCLECPLPVCRYEVPGGIRQIRAMERDAEATRLMHEGLTPKEIGVSLGMPERSAWRSLKRDRERAS